MMIDFDELDELEGTRTITEVDSVRSYDAAPALETTFTPQVDVQVRLEIYNFNELHLDLTQNTHVQDGSRRFKSAMVISIQVFGFLTALKKENCGLAWATSKRLKGRTN